MAEDRRQLLEKADRAAQKGDMASAASLYRRAASSGPPDPSLLQRLGDALARAGADGEARETFRQLADEYWRQGHRARALAALRRAARLGPADGGLLALLGQRLAEQGLVADAREPLLEAARIAEQRGDRAGASALFRQVADLLPRDPVSREGLARLADAGSDPGERAVARAELGLARLRLGDAAGAASSFAAALVADPTQLTALEAIRRLGPTVEAGAPALPADPPPNLSPALGGAWLLLAAASRPRRPEFVPALREAALQPGAPAAVRLWAGRMLLERDDVEGSQRVLATLEPDAAQDPGLCRDLVDALSRVVSRAPGEQRAAELLVRLSFTGEGPADGAPATPAAGARPGPEATGFGFAGPADRDLSVAARARLLEAHALLEQRLPDRARAALDAVPAADRDHDDYLALDARVRAALPPPVTPTALRRPSTSGPTPAAAPPRRPAPAPPPPDDDDPFVVLDETGEVAPPPPASRTQPAMVIHLTNPQGVRRPATPPAAAAAGRGPAGGSAPAGPAGGAPGFGPADSDGLDLGQLQDLLRQRVDPDDAETNYQMALGLVEMGLGEQAVPLLESLLGDSARQIDATLLLVRVREEAGEARRGMKEAAAVLNAAAGAAPAMKAELCAAIVDLALKCGRPTEARTYLTLLGRFAPTHPALPRLRRRVQESID